MSMVAKVMSPRTLQLRFGRLAAAGLAAPAEPDAARLAQGREDPDREPAGGLAAGRGGDPV
jgi:hypothetical protein